MSNTISIFFKLKAIPEEFVKVNIPIIAGCFFDSRFKNHAFIKHFEYTRKRLFCLLQALVVHFNISCERNNYNFEDVSGIL